MERIDRETVRLTDEEMSAHDCFEEELDNGLDPMNALASTLRKFPDLSDDFQAYLVD